jgi:hypothetical protein
MKNLNILKTCNDSIVKVIEEAVETSPVSIEVVSGAITVEELKRLFKKRLSVTNPEKFVDKIVKGKVKYKKELYNRVPNLVEKSKDKSKSVQLIAPGGSINNTYMAVGHILGTANRILEDEELVFKGMQGNFFTLELV